MRAVGDFRPFVAGCDAIVHSAGLAHVSEGRDAAVLARAVNTEVTARLADAAVREGVRRFVFISSAHVSGARSGAEPLREEQIPQPATVYARSKFDAENALQETARGTPMTWTILRPPMVYGPAAPGNFARLAKLALSGWPLPFGCATAEKSFIGVENLISAILRAVAAKEAANKIFLVADTEAISTAGLIRLIAQLKQRPPRLLPVPPAILRAAGGMMGRGRDIARVFDPYVIDTRHIRTCLSWVPPVSLEAGVAAALNLR